MVSIAAATPIAERLLSESTNWKSRPVGDIRLSILAARKQSLTVHGH
jgi:hypothetical protein